MRAASRVESREGRGSRAPALSSALVASARRRPARPRCGPHGDRGVDLGAGACGSEPVVDVEADRAGGGQREPVDSSAVVDLPRRSRRGGRPGGRRPARVLPASERAVVLDVERHGRPARSGVRVGQHVRGRPRGAPRRSRWRSRSSWPERSQVDASRVVGPRDDCGSALRMTPASSSGMTPGSSLLHEDIRVPARQTSAACPPPSARASRSLIGAALAAGVLGRARVPGRPGGHAAPRRSPRCCWPRSRCALVGGRRAPLAGALVGLRRRSRCCPRSRASTTTSCSCRSPPPFVASYWLGAYGSRRAARARRSCPCAALGLLGDACPTTTTSTFTGGLFTRRGRRSSRRCVVGRLLRSRARAQPRAAREGRAARAPPRGRRRPRGARRAHADRGRAARRRRPRAERDDRAGHRRAPARADAAGARARGVRRDRDRRPRGARRAAPAARRAAPRGRRAHAAPQPSLRHVRSLVRRTTAAPACR